MAHDTDTQHAKTERFGRLLDWSIALALTSLALVVYNATLTPSLSYKSPDGNELATVPYLLGLAHSTGYPLYTWLGKLFTYLAHWRCRPSYESHVGGHGSRRRGAGLSDRPESNSQPAGLHLHGDALCLLPYLLVANRHCRSLRS